MEHHVKIEVYKNLFAELKNAFQGNDQAALIVLQELGKDRRMDNVRMEREARAALRKEPIRIRLNGNPENASAPIPATDNQRRFLKSSLGYEVPETMTKRQASDLIDEIKGKTPGEGWY